jgi:Putative prokaryotic signal transducing protein
MAQLDPDQERQRLRKLYAGMEKEELEQIAGDAAALTDVAREALGSEMAQRGMHLPKRKSFTVAANSREHSKPVMIRRFLYLSEAEVAKSILNSAGIESFLADENIVRLDWFYSNLVGGIKLLVRAEDADEAGKLLDDSHAQDISDSPEEQSPEEKK